MKIVSKMLVVSSLSMGLMTSARAIESNEPAYFSPLADFMAEFERCWQEDMREFHGSFVGTKKDVQAKSEGVDYAKFTIQEVGKNDKAVYGVRITLPGVDPRSIKINLRNDNGNKKLSLTASLAAAKQAQAAEVDKAVAPVEAVASADEQGEQSGTPAVDADKSVAPEATEAKGATSAPSAKQDAAKAVTKEGRAERSYASQQMYTYKMVNGRTREMTIKDGQITITMDLPAVDISAFEKSFKDGVIAIDFSKEASVEERTISFDGEPNENVADEQPEK
jgi:HSP20 family molecular chaperone IbpA